MKMYVSSYNGDTVVSVVTDLFLEHDLDFQVYQLLKNHHYVFEKNTPAGLCFELFFIHLEKGTGNEPVSVSSAQLLQVLQVATPVGFNSNFPGFNQYRTENTIGIIGLDPLFIYLKQAVNQLVPGVYMGDSDCMLRVPIYFKNREKNDELTVSTLGQGRYTDIIAPLTRIGLRN